MALALIPPPVKIADMRIYNPPLLNLDYPAAYGMRNLLVQQRINASIYALLQRLVRELKYPDTVTYISTAYEIKTNERNILSLTLNGLGDFHGAHPINGMRSITFDTRTGKHYDLHELFNSNSDYLQKLSDIVAEQIKEREIPLVDEFTGLKPNQDYYIADTSIVIYFQQGEITPNYVGIPRFPISLYDIQDIIPEDSLLQRLF